MLAAWSMGCWTVICCWLDLGGLEARHVVRGVGSAQQVLAAWLKCSAALQVASLA